MYSSVLEEIGDALHTHMCSYILTHYLCIFVWEEIGDVLHMCYFNTLFMYLCLGGDRGCTPYVLL